jgi:hypothetical protein
LYRFHIFFGEPQMSTTRGPGQAWWESHLNAIAREGITVKAYARREGLDESSLYYWRRRIRTQTQGPQQPVIDRSSVDAPSSRRFVSVAVNATHDATGARHVLILDSSLRLELSSLPNPQWLAQVSQALSAQAR